ncbi:MAG: hypothetical protein WC303_02065 [Candidatus Paceibacterota bacterium]|jgi:hypothetical protein
MNKKTILLLIASLVLLVVSAGIVYMFGLSEYDSNKKYDDQIKSLEAQKSLGADRNQKLSQAEQSLIEVNWPEKKEKIDANFISTPFFLSEINLFFQDIIKRSKMSLISLSFTEPASIDGVGASNKEQPVLKNTTGSSGTTEVPVKKSTSSFGSIQGPVRVTTVTISANGTYDQFKNLLKIFENQAYLISIKSIRFSGGTAISSYNISAEIYSY